MNKQDTQKFLAEAAKVGDRTKALVLVEVTHDGNIHCFGSGNSYERASAASFAAQLEYRRMITEAEKPSAEAPATKPEDGVA